MAGRIVSAGQKLHRAFSAREWNAVRAQVLAPHLATRLGPAGPGDARDGVIRIVNKTGELLEPYEVVGLDVAAITPADSEAEFRSALVFEGVVPQEEHFGRFAVLLEPCGVNEIAAACIDGITPAKIDVANTCHDFADVDPDSTAALVSAYTGSAHILWKESGAGEKWALVRLGKRPSGIFICYASNAIPGRSGTTLGQGEVTLYNLDDAGVISALSCTETAYNLSEEEVQPNVPLMALRESASGKLLVNWEECGAS